MVPWTLPTTERILKMFFLKIFSRITRIFLHLVRSQARITTTTGKNFSFPVPYPISERSSCGFLGFHDRRSTMKNPLVSPFSDSIYRRPYRTVGVFSVRSCLRWAPSKRLTNGFLLFISCVCELLRRDSILYGIPLWCHVSILNGTRTYTIHVLCRMMRSLTLTNNITALFIASGNCHDWLSLGIMMLTLCLILFLSLF